MDSGRPAYILAISVSLSFSSSSVRSFIVRFLYIQVVLHCTYTYPLARSLLFHHDVSYVENQP